MEDLDVEVPAETLFMEANDVAVRLAKREVLLSNGSPTHTCPRPHPVPSQLFTEPLYAPPDSEYTLEPRTDAPSLRHLKPSQL